MVKEKEKKKKYITLNRINLNAGLISWYEKELIKLVKLMCKVYEDKLLSLYQSKKEQIKKIKYAQDDNSINIGTKSKELLNKLNDVYSQYYDKKGKEKSDLMVTKVERALKKQLEASFYLFFSKLASEKPEDKIFKQFISQFSPEVLNNKEKFIKAFTLKVKPFREINEQIKQTIIMNNTELIKSIHQQYHKEVSQSIYDVIVNGKPSKDLKEQLLKCGAKTRRRADLIAHDQINKTHSLFYLQELKQAGITKAKWVHIGGGKTDRVTHITATPYGLNNGIFDITKGMYDPAVKKFIFPAELPFCRCQAIALAGV